MTILVQGDILNKLLTISLFHGRLFSSEIQNQVSMRNKNQNRDVYQNNITVFTHNKS